MWYSSGHVRQIEQLHIRTTKQLQRSGTLTSSHQMVLYGFIATCCRIPVGGCDHWYSSSAIKMRRGGQHNTVQASDITAGVGTSATEIRDGGWEGRERSWQITQDGVSHLWDVDFTVQDHSKLLLNENGFLTSSSQVRLPAGFKQFPKQSDCHTVHIQQCNLLSSTPCMHVHTYSTYVALVCTLPFGSSCWKHGAPLGQDCADVIYYIRQSLTQLKRKVTKEKESSGSPVRML